MNILSLILHEEHRAYQRAGPIIYYLAKVDNAANAGTTGLQWFKVSHDGLSNGKWAVDTMIQNGGWHYFNMPTCVAPGDYLLRVELIALHGAQNSGQAQCKFSSLLSVILSRHSSIIHFIQLHARLAKPSLADASEIV